ncbi:hypothetical protein SAMN05660429_02732 [Thalassotalea agarivorans]|uniref:Uncharacterized protein n=1 Tax=Thalassotalea agarivorans TaxID=349064 RepID=A0A1I0HA49_THASX|nr:hypothetical protein SAMN05660429_02732 [Thalassotalea agarivorans]
MGINDRLSLTFEDWLGLLPTYGVIIAIACLIAFLVASLLAKKLTHYRISLHVLAGVVAFTLVLLAIESLMNIHIIAGARGWGFYAQLIAGATGGYVFARLSQTAKD